ncbi:MAG: class I SAM-dependent methyltransferase [Polynucleobacter sp.]|nr:class I SAM-dependent methyltransferase [Polynucleobacter sp.]
MNDWTSGYVTDIEYTYGYYGELNPLRTKLAFINAGIASPEFKHACELGFGQGVSINIHASASNIAWFGTDFNPAQASFAQELNANSGNGVRLFDNSFSEFAERSDLPEFDYIGLHGIWSWISDENRVTIVDFIKRKLRAGGILYISYNTQPGLSNMVPMRDLLVDHMTIMGAAGDGVVKRINGAINFAEEFFSTNPKYAKANPIVVEKMKKIKEQNRHYLAHEYFNKDWLPMTFSQMSGWLSEAKLNYVCSASYLDYFDALNISKEQVSFLNKIADVTFREMVRSFMMNQEFRRDYWVKGKRSLGKKEQIDAFREQRLVLVSPADKISLKISRSDGELTLDEKVYSPIIDLMADHEPRTIAEIETLLKDKDLKFDQIVQAVLILSGLGFLQPAQNDDLINKTKKLAGKLNQSIILRSQNSGDVTTLASPVLGGGIHVGHTEILFLLAIMQGKKKPSEWAETAWGVLQEQSWRIVVDSKTLQTPEEKKAELNKQSELFASQKLPIYKKLQMI